MAITPSPLIGALYTAASRVFMKEIRLEPETEKSLKRYQKQIETFSDVFKDLDTTNPISWGRTGIKLMGYLLDEHRSGEYSTVWKYVRENDLSYFRTSLGFVIRKVVEDSPRTMVMVDEWSVLFKSELPNGVPIWIQTYPGEEAENSSLYFDRSQNSEEELIQGFVTLFWGNDTAIEIDYRNETFVSYSTNLSSYKYYGPLDQMVERWRLFMERGIRRNVLIQGKPGTGKTTFCYEAAHRLSERTLVLSGEFVEEASESLWKALITMMDPQFVVVNDIDRLGEEELSLKLRMFEEGFCDVPCVFFTSNDIGAFPEAMLRPGRIDQKIVLTTPPEEVCVIIIKGMAQDVGVEVPEEHMEKLIQQLKSSSPAYVKEAMRRALVQGWNSVESEMDQTFSFTGEKNEQSKD